MARCRTIEHTADIGIEVEADSLEELFEGVAAGMFSIIIDPARVSAEVERRVVLHAGDLGELMYEWLNELLYLLGADGLLLSSFEVERFQRDEGFRLEATVGGERLDPERHGGLEEIKAATYHQMTIERRDGAWFARVIFDV